VKLSSACFEDSVLGFSDELEPQLLPQQRIDHLGERHLHALVAQLVPGLKIKYELKKNLLIIKQS